MRPRDVVVLLGALLVAVGGGLLLGSAVRSGPPSQPTLTAIADAHARSDELQRLLDEATAAQTAGEEFAAAVATLVLEGRLAGRSVLLVTTPGGAAQRSGVEAMLQGAGATIGGRLGLTDWFTDPERSDDLLDLAAASLPPSLRDGLPATADGVGAAGALLAGVLLERMPAAPDDEVRSVLAAFVSRKFLTPDSVVSAPADAVVLVTGAAPGEAILMSFVDALGSARGGGPVVVAGSSAERGTLVSAVRRDTGLAVVVSTVDDVATPRGTLVSAWAVADLFDGYVGHYGTGPGADPLPDPSASPDPTASAQPSVTAGPSATPARQSGTAVG